MKTFLNAKTHPLNLAVFRIAVFLTFIIRLLYYDPVWFTGMPAEFRNIPLGLGRIMPYVPLDERTVHAAHVILIVLCVMGLIGFFARTSAALTALLGVYVIGVVQIHGKMTHCHHMIWFAALLAVSRCADVLSVDAVFKAFKRADKGITDPPGPAEVYARPLVFIFLLIGLAYFFPGYWKLKNVGLQWFWSDNLKWHLYRKWGELLDWQPLFRIDHYPLLCKLSGLGTVVFEVGFIFLIFIPWLRPWLALGGILFHQATRSIMGISFWFLQTGYVALFDWDAISKWSGARLFPTEMVLIYDGQCGMCRRAAATLRVFDFLGRIRYVKIAEASLLKLPGVRLDHDALMKDMHAVTGQTVKRGYEAYQALAWRIPLLWPAAPILYFPPVAWMGRLIYRRVADSRTCSIVPPPKPVLLNKPEPSFSFERLSLLFVGTMLVLLVGLTGFLNITSWPFSVYPTFDTMMEHENRILVIKAYDREGNDVPFDRRLFYKKFDPSRWQVIQNKPLEYLMDEQYKFQPYLRALWKFIADRDPQARKAVKVRFYKAGFTGDPDRKAENPMHPELIYELSL